MNVFVFSILAQKKLLKLPNDIQARIVEKLTALKKHEDIFILLKILHNFKPATHRLRVGNYRIILESVANNATSNEFLILDVGHRKDIYK